MRGSHCEAVESADKNMVTDRVESLGQVDEYSRKGVDLSEMLTYKTLTNNAVLRK